MSVILWQSSFIEGGYIDIPSGKGFTLFFENGAVLEDGKDYLKVRT
jgi:hypothetical protein